MNTLKSSVEDVLLAEDDLDDVLYFELALKEIPFSVVLRNARDGDKLFIMLNEKKPDILFLDINMPCKDGITCIAEIRQNKAYDDLPVIMYTSMSNEKYIEDSYRSGANMYLVKSANIRTLAESLKKILEIDWKKTMYYPSRSQFVVGMSG